MAVSGQARVLSKFLMRQWVARGMLPKHNPACCDHVLACACSNAVVCITARSGYSAQFIHIPEASPCRDQVV